MRWSRLAASVALLILPLRAHAQLFDTGDLNGTAFQFATAQRFTFANSTTLTQFGFRGGVYNGAGAAPSYDLTFYLWNSAGTLLDSWTTSGNTLAQNATVATYLSPVFSQVLGAGDYWLGTSAPWFYKAVSNLGDIGPQNGITQRVGTLQHSGGDLNLQGALSASQNLSWIIYGERTVTNGPVTTVPEPSTYALLAAGLAGLGFLRRRHRRA